MKNTTIIIASNKYLSEYIKNEYNYKLLSCNKKYWMTIQIYTLEEWLIEYWQKTNDKKIILTNIQENFIWKKIINENINDNFNFFLKIAKNFHKLINMLEIKDNQNNSDENDILYLLNDKFIEYCKKNNLISKTEVLTKIIPYIKKLQLVNVNIKLVGFNKIYPQLKRLIQIFKKVGIKVKEERPCMQISNYTNKYLKFINEEEEILAIVSWIKKILSFKKDNTIGILVPNLINSYSNFLRIFEQLFKNKLNLNIYIKILLKDIAVSKCIINIITIKDQIKIENLAEILSSPYIRWNYKEKNQRIILKYHLQQLHFDNVTLDDIDVLLKKNHINISQFFTTLKKYRKLYLSIKDKQMFPSQWSKIFIKIIKIFEWPKLTDLNIIEKSAVDKIFKILLKDFISLNSILGKITFDESINIFKTIINEKKIIPWENSLSKINILDITDAIGMKFDYIWIMKLNEENLLSENDDFYPFFSILAEKKLLHNLYEKNDLDDYMNLIKSYQTKFTQILLSYVEKNDERSDLLDMISKESQKVSLSDLNIEMIPSSIEKIYYSKQIENVIDTQNQIFNKNEKINLSCKLLETQSLCPFRAFAEYRLNATKNRIFHPGVLKQDRGIIIHGCLEYFWKNVKNQINLKNLNLKQIKKLIYQGLKIQLNKLNYKKNIHRIEIEYLLPLLMNFVELEKNRANFEVISIEKPIQLSISNVTLNLRIDRIDLLDDGTIIIIDYKTGKFIPNLNDWIGTRLKNLQMILYSLSMKSMPKLAFAQINKEKIGIKYIDSNKLISSLQCLGNKYHENIESSNLLMQYWNDKIKIIIDDFISGIVTIDPINKQICNKCDIYPICRISYKYLKF